MAQLNRLLQAIHGQIGHQDLGEIFVVGLGGAHIGQRKEAKEEYGYLPSGSVVVLSLFKLLEYCYYAVLCLILCWISIPVNLSGSNATNNEFPSLSPVAVAMFCR